MTYSATPKSLLDAIQISHRAPALSNETFLGNIKVEHVQRVVDGLDLAHFDGPHFNVLGRSHQNSVPVVLGLS